MVAMATTLFTVYCKLFHIMPYIIILKVREFHQPTASRFSTARKNPVGLCPPPSLNRLKGRCKRENIVSEAKLGPRRKFCVFNICCVGSQTRKHFGNTEEALIFNVSRLFLRLRAKATCSEDAEFASGKQKCFASFPFARWLTHATL